ncbi:MAG: hypothetical protein JXD23_11735 [Spirochaetales bacterium]|nr:hypothetical protein [Spirochaetales bacterium]
MQRLTAWITIEPFITLLMIIAAITLFLRSYRAVNQEGPVKFWYWLRKILESIGVTILFLGLLWVSRAVLNNNYQTFISNHGRVSQANYESVQNIWGGTQAQRDLSVRHSIERDVMEEIPRADETKPPLYKKVRRRFTIEQNSILSTHGTVELRTNKRQKGSAFYNGFETKFNFTYTVKNDSDVRTDADFRFPLPSSQSMFSDVVILVNDRDVSKDLRVSSSAIAWRMQMDPGQTWTVKVRYQTRGLEYFYYQIPSPRQIKDFDFTLTAVDLPVSEINYPEGCIPPTQEIIPTAGGRGSILTWRFNDTITTAGMGVSLPKPEQPGERTSLMLAASSYGLMMLLLAVALTFILADKRINLLEIALIAGVYCLMYILAASLNDTFLHFWGSFTLGTIVTCGLTVLFSLKFEPLYKMSLLGLVGFFSLVYPLLSQFKDITDSLNGLVMAAMIAYLFAMAVATRFRKPGIAGNQEKREMKDVRKSYLRDVKKDDIHSV